MPLKKKISLREEEVCRPVKFYNKEKALATNQRKTPNELEGQKQIFAIRKRNNNIANDNQEICDNIPSTISDLAVCCNSPYDLRGYKKAVVPRFSTFFVKNSIRYRGAVLWNLVSDYFKDSFSFKQFHRKVQSDPKFREFRFISS